MRLTLVFLFSALLPPLAAARADTDPAALWQALRAGGHVVLIRHAVAPGTGDPPELTIGDCSTQRNLDRRGRDQAAAIGARFRAAGIAAARVYASQWCRCRETAELLGLGPVTELPILNSFHRWPERRGPQTRALADWLAAADLSQPTVLVTHQVNISGLTGRFTSSGELVVVRRGGDGTHSVVGTIETR